MEGIAPEGEEGCEALPITFGPCLNNHVDQGSTESLRYYLARRTLLEMLRDRGYAVPTSEIKTSLESFRELHGQSPDVDSLRISVHHRTDPVKRMLVIFCGTGIVKVNVVRSIVSQIVHKDSLTGLILVLQNKITSQATKALDVFGVNVEVLQITDLLVNITNHVLKPKHRVLSNEEKQKILKKYNIDEKQLPRLSRKDAIAQYYGMEKGQVVKVTYSGEITESHVTYRCVW